MDYLEKYAHDRLDELKMLREQCKKRLKGSMEGKEQKENQALA